MQMQNGNFLDTRRQSPASAALVIALHGAALTALILSPPEFVRDQIKTLTAYNVPIDKPPPENPPPPPPERREQAAVTRTDPLVTTFPPDRSVDLVRVDPPPLPPILPPADPPTVLPPSVFAEAQVDPRFAGAFQPAYPPAMARQEIEGRAVVRVLVGTDGRVKAVELVSTTDAAFFEATRRQALRAWRFKPATRDGVPRESWRTMTVRFQMQA